MEITIKAKPIKTIIGPWLFTSFILLGIFVVFLLATYSFWGYKSHALGEYLFSSWSFFWVYFPISSLVIAFQTRIKTITIKPNGTVDIDGIKDMLEKLKWKMVSDQGNYLIFDHKNWFERLFLSGNKVTIEHLTDSIIFNVPARLVYDINHGFKFGKFIKQEN